MNSMPLPIKAFALATAALLSLGACATEVNPSAEVPGDGDGARVEAPGGEDSPRGVLPDVASNAIGVLNVPDNIAAESWVVGTARYVFVPENEDGAYYEGASIWINEDTVIADRDGNALALADLAAPIHVELWAPECQESFPVQCDAVALRVLSTP